VNKYEMIEAKIERKTKGEGEKAFYKLKIIQLKSIGVCVE
jgi:hypothetical protein